MNISAALSRVPIRRAPGRPHNRDRPLAAKDDHEGYFAVQNLTRHFIRRPIQLLQWRILDDF